jgi:hypothetical protein
MTATTKTLTQMGLLNTTSATNAIDLTDQQNDRVELANALTERALQSLTG